jgi:hypothetical protein
MITRRHLINTHMFLSAFFAPAILFIAISGGSYLLGFKGDKTEELVYHNPVSQVNFESETLDEDVSNIFKRVGLDYQYEYLKVSGNKIITRPATRPYYELKVRGNGQLELKKITPDLQSRIVELHKGHGPGVFKNYQKIFAIGLLVIVISGLWLGISATSLRMRSLITFLLGSILFLFLAF